VARSKEKKKNGSMRNQANKTAIFPSLQTQPKKQCSSSVANKIHIYISCCKETNYSHIKKYEKRYGQVM
jgi:hypothetical protein